MSEFNFQGAVAVVTGGAGGIGRALAARLTAEGSRVAIVDLDRASAEEAAAALPQWPACTASEIAVSCEAIEPLCPDESRPLPLDPQATTKAAANPRIAASDAREPNPIGG